MKITREVLFLTPEHLWGQVRVTLLCFEGVTVDKAHIRGNHNPGLFLDENDQTFNNVALDWEHYKLWQS